ncbi:hypothetical protein [Ferviditalea candida]|uniref:DsrE/DsrF-like family protein n=1 Tax=Ferviditalea candida TaxID=3108399 RepID=A0ABU5ZMP8_9BACL|nr:hypothetical protein [Paenibacillaceae bacterium T2]
MSTKLLVILSTAEKEKALSGLLYTANALKRGWLPEVKVVFFGPFEKLLVEDKDVREKAAEVLGKVTPVACKFISDNEGISDDIRNLGFDVDFVGKIISDYLMEGYVPMVF